MAAITAAGCDRENSAQPQPTAQASPQSPIAARYAIDRSHKGSALPDTLVVDGQGRVTTLGELDDAPIVLNLWATWCAPCVEELPTLNAMAAANAGRVHVIALSQDFAESGVSPVQFLATHGWTDLIGWRDPENAIGLTHGAGLPTTILYNRQGDEVVRVIGPMDWTGETARTLLAEAGIGG